MDMLLTPQQAAEALALTVKAIHRLCRDGELEFVQINRRGDRRFTEKQLHDFITRRTVKSEIDKANRKAVRCSPQVSSNRIERGDAGKSGNSAEVADLRKEMRQWR